MPGGYDSPSNSGAIELSRCVQADKTLATTTPAAQTDLTVPLGLGVYPFMYFLILQSAATTTGHKFNVNFTGTKGLFAYTLRWLTNVAANSDDVATSAFVTAGAGVVSGYAARAGATSGTMVITDVDTINADVLYIIEGLVTVTVAGNMELWWGCDAAANATMKAGSSLVAWKTG